MERRLAAILAADMVGYSRLVDDDEEGTLRALGAYRQIIDGLVADRHGRIFGSAGDSVVAEFASPVEAVRCSIAIQEAIGKQNAALSEDRRMAFRIGVNLGDVVVDGDNLLGDGVNIAARLEGLAEPGGVWVSADIYRQVKGKVEATFEDLGDHEIKNIGEPVRAYRVALNAVAEVPASAPLALPDKPSIAVLPFDNMSGDAEQEYFSDGITEDIITALSRMPWFFVIARNSSFTYNGRAVDVKTVARELGVRYVLEGSVRKAGQRVRITGQLVDAITGNHVWADRYDRELTDIFAVQDEVTEAIVGAVAPEFLSIEAKRAQAKDPNELDAWDYVMRGRWHLWRLGREDLAKARPLFERAIELVPSGEYGAADLAVIHLFEAYYSWSESRAHSMSEMMRTAKMGVAANDHDAWAHTALGLANLFALDWDEALPPVERAIDLYPSFAPALGVKCLILACIEQPDAAIACFDEASRLSPRDSFTPIWLVGRTFALFNAGRYEEAVESAKRMVRLTPDNPTAHRHLAASLGMVGRIDEAREAIDTYRRLEPDHTLEDVRGRVPARNPAELDIFIEGMRRAGWDE